MSVSSSMPSPEVHLLPKEVANQIAAGEVVKRPSSVLKELLENSLDAAASAIKILIKQGGKTLIQVIDNGKGMGSIDARNSFRRHTTSKLTNTKDLYNLTTYGFRGEALNAISSVAKVTLTTKREGDPLGCRITIEEGKMRKEEIVNTPTGSNIKVFHLFSNLPARRAFLKHDALERASIIENFQAIALANPGVAFSFYQEEKLIYQLPSAALQKRIGDLLGLRVQEKLLPCNEKTPSLTIKGFIAPPSQAYRRVGRQWFFVNQRWIKDSRLHHAVKKAFSPLLPLGRFPTYLLSLTLPPDQIDVNIHPHKTQVKFQSPEPLYGMITSSIRKTLAYHQFTPSLDFEAEENQKHFIKNAVALTSPFSDQGKAAISEDTQKTIELRATSLPFQKKIENPNVAIEASQINQVAQKPMLPTFFQLHKRLVLTQVASGLLLIDQQAAHQQILYERYLKLLGQKKGAIAQQRLFPIEIKLTPKELARLEAVRTTLYQLGFRFEVIPPEKIILLGQPSESNHLDPSKLIEKILDEHNSTLATMTPPQKIAQNLAKRTSIQAGKTLLVNEMQELVNDLFACKNSYKTVNGKLIWRIIPLNELYKGTDPK